VKSDANHQMARRTNDVDQQLRERRAQLAENGERYSRASTQTRLVRVDRASTSTVVARVEEWTQLEYVKVSGDEPDYTAFKAQRDFAFERDAGRWVLSDVRYVDEGGIPPVNEVLTAPAGGGPDAAPPGSAVGRYRNGEERRSSDKTTRGTDGSFSIASGYNYGAMADYARRYVFNYNPDYRRFEQDCTNFISQAMRAGGWTDVLGWYTSNSAWWYNSENQSYTWAGAQNWYWFATRSGRTFILGSIWNLALADVLQLDFDKNGNIDHSMIVTKTTADGEKYLTYHTTNTLDRSLSSIRLAYPNAAYYAHRT
jgi:hypothetical protein